MLENHEHIKYLEKHILPEDHVSWRRRVKKYAQ